jgi:PAS domain S-box-containing protein
MSDRPKILIVDGEAPSCDSLITLLEHKGLEIHTCHSAREAMSFLAKDKVDLAVLEIRLPDASGLEVLEWIDPKHSSTSVVAMTYHPSTESVREVMKKGAYDYLRKPLDHNELLQVIDDALYHRRRDEERKRADDEMNLQKRRLEGLWNTARLVDCDYKTLCDHVLAEVLDMTLSRYAFYGFLDQDESVLNIYSWSEKALSQCRVKQAPLHFPIAEAGIWAEAVRMRSPVIINDYRVEHPAKKGLPQGHVPITRLLSMPIFRDGRIVAVVAAANKDSDYTLDDMRQMETFATNVQIILDHRKLREALQQTEERFRLVLGNSLDALYRRNLKTDQFDYVSSVFEQIIGFTPDELNLMGIDKVLQRIHPDDRDHVSQDLERISKDGKGLLEYRFLTKEGEYRWLGVTISVTNDKEGCPLHRVGVVRDITASKLIEKALLFKENIIESSSSVIATCDLEGNMTYGNPSFLKAWGFDDPKEFLGRPFWEFWLVKDRHDEIMQALREDGIWSDEIKAKRKDGGVFDVQVSAATVFDSGGHPIALTSTSIDITGRKRAEKALRESEQRLRLAIKTADLAIWDYDVTKDTVRWDNLWKTLFDGPLKRDNAYKWWSEHIHPEDRGAVLSKFNDAVADKRESLVVEYRFQRTDGGWTNLYDRCHIMRDESGKACRIIGAVMDVTALRRVERELRQAREELERRVEERTAELDKRTRDLEAQIAKREQFEKALKGSAEKLVEQLQQRKQLSAKLVELLEKDRRDTAMVLHDQVGSILTGAKLEIEAMEAELAMDPAVDRISKVKEKTTEAMKMIRNISSHLRPSSLDHFGLVPAITSLTDEIKRQSGIMIRVHSQGMSERFSPEKELALYRIVQESLTNVLKHAAANEVFITISCREDAIHLSVEDDGRGFDYGELDKERFLQGHLGISIMRERVSQFSGSFEIETKPGKGTQVIVEIPIG